MCCMVFFFLFGFRRRESNELYVIWIPFFFLFCNENILLNSRIGFWNSCFISLRTLSAVWFMLNGKKILDFIELNCTKAKCMLSFSSLILLNCRFSILLFYRNIIYLSPIQKNVNLVLWSLIVLLWVVDFWVIPLHISLIDYLVSSKKSFFFFLLSSVDLNFWHAVRFSIPQIISF